jgi:hypothetical protein
MDGQKQNEANDEVSMSLSDLWVLQAMDGHMDGQKQNEANDEVSMSLSDLWVLLALKTLYNAQNALNFMLRYGSRINFSKQKK